MKFKKMFIILFFAILFIVAFMPKSNATSPSELPDQLYQIGYPYGMTAADKTRVERFINQYGMTDSQSNAIMAKAREVEAILRVTGTSNISTADLNRLKNIANDTASIVNATLVFTSRKTADIYVNNVLFDSVTIQSQGNSGGTSGTGTGSGSTSSSSSSSSKSKLVYTGNSNKIIYIISFSASTIIILYFMKKKVYDKE